jgi:uncharacterized delta-60 repeat protein
MMKKMKITLSTLLALGTAFLTANTNAQQAGDIDASWASSGWLMDDHASNEGEVYSTMKNVSNNRYMMVGRTNDANMDMLLALYNADGTLDNTFGNQGVLRIDVSLGLDDGAYDIAELWDGKFLVVGATTGAQSVEMIITRLNADGSVDNSFGTAGQVRYDAGLGSWFIPSAVKVSALNNIFIAGSVYNGVSWDFVVLKLTQGGGFVANYGTNGVSVMNVDSSEDELMAIHVTAGEEVIFAGNASYGGTQSAILAKLDANGDLDPNFNLLGFVEYSEATMNYFNDLYVDGSGNIYVTGHEGLGDDMNGIVMKFVADGSTDLTFATNGKLVMDIGAANGIHYQKIAMKNDGNFIVTGHVTGQTLNQIHAFSFEPNGTADCEFSCSGVYHDFTISTVSFEQNLLMIMNDGSVLTGGYLTSQDFVGENMYVVKLLIEEQVANLNEMDADDVVVTVYPNPTSDQFKVSTAAEIMQVSLMDLNGSRIQNWENSDVFKLDEHISSGIYFIQVQTNQGMSTQKIQINK